MSLLQLGEGSRLDKLISVEVILPGEVKSHVDLSKRRTVDEAKQIIITKNPSLDGSRVDYFLVLDDQLVLVPEFKKLGEFPAFQKVLDGKEYKLRFVHKKDVEVKDNKEHMYKPRPDIPSEPQAHRHARLEKRQSQMMEDTLFKLQMMEEQERRRAQRRERDAKEEEQIRRELEKEEQRRREQLELRTGQDRKREEEREREEAERKKREADEEAEWSKFREARRKLREEQRAARREQTTPGGPGSRVSMNLDMSKLSLDIPRDLSASAGSRSSVGMPRSPRGEEDHALQEQLTRMEKLLQGKNAEIEEAKKAQAAAEAANETNKALVDSLRLRLERLERDVERAKQKEEARAQQADKEIALLKAVLSRFKSLRDCIAGELTRINTAPLTSLNNVETRVALDRVMNRIDAALTGHNWRSTKEEFTTCLFPMDELKDLCVKSPPKDPKMLAEAATEGSAIPLHRLEANFADSPTSYRHSPVIPATAEPEVEKICALDPKFEIDYWQLLPGFGDLIGEGGYAEVYKATYNDKVVAVKKFKINHQAMENGESPMDTDLIRREILVLSKLDHPNIMKFYGASVVMPNICIVTEFLEKGGFDELLYNKNVDLPFKLRIKIAIDTAQGLNYLHTRNPIVIHRDIKSGNVLLDGQFNAKLSDFGLSKVKSRPFEMPTSKAANIPKGWSVVLNSSPVGTAGWAAPEILEHAPYNELADIYSFGVFLWELHVRKQPWEGKEGHEVVQEVLEGHRLEPPADMHPELAKLVKHCFVYDPWGRPTAEIVIKELRKLHDSL